MTVTKVAMRLLLTFVLALMPTLSNAKIYFDPAGSGKLYPGLRHGGALTAPLPLGVFSATWNDAAGVYALSNTSKTGSQWTQAYQTPEAAVAAGTLPAGWGYNSSTGALSLNASTAGTTIEGWDFSNARLQPDPAATGITLRNSIIGSKRANSFTGNANLIPAANWTVEYDTFIGDQTSGGGFANQMNATDGTIIRFNNFQGHGNGDGITMSGRGYSIHDNYFGRIVVIGGSHCDQLSAEGGYGVVYRNYFNAKDASGNVASGLNNVLRAQVNNSGSAPVQSGVEFYNNIAEGWPAGQSLLVQASGFPSTMSSNPLILGIASFGLNIHDNIWPHIVVGYPGYVGFSAWSGNTYIDDGTAVATATDVDLSYVPKIQGSPTAIATKAVVGVATSVTSAATFSPQNAIAYQWSYYNAANGQDYGILGATSATYTPVAADIGKVLRRWEYPQNTYTRGTQPSATSGYYFVSNATAAVLTNAAPILKSASVAYQQGGVLNLLYDSALDTGSVPAASAFAITSSASAVTVSSVAISGSAVALTLSRTIAAGETLSISYTVPGTNPIRNAGSTTNAAALSAQAVVNNVANDPGKYLRYTLQGYPGIEQPDGAGYDYTTTYPYDGVNSGTGMYAANVGVPAFVSGSTSGDGFVGFQIAALGKQSCWLGVRLTNTKPTGPASNSDFDYSIQANGSGVYVVAAKGTGVTADATVNAAVGDLVRLRRTGTSLVAEVSKDGGQTYTAVKTFTLANNTTAMYPGVHLANSISFAKLVFGSSNVN